MIEQHYLIFGGPGIGDTVIELCLAKALKRAIPNSTVDIIFSGTLGSKEVIYTLLKHQQYIDRCYCYNKSKIVDLFRLLLELRSNRYKYLFSCPAEFKANKYPSVLSKLIGCKSIGKQVDGKTGKLDFSVLIDEDIHIVEQYQKILETIGISIKMNGKVLDTDCLEQVYPLEKSYKKQITICLGANITIYQKDGKRVRKQIKEWNMTNWIRLSCHLYDMGYDVILLGGKKEKEHVKKSRLSVDSRILNLLGETTISESLSILYQSSLVVGADTGMMHCAAALGKPTLTLFGGTDSNVWKPYSEISYVITGIAECSPCYGKQYAINCSHRKCMDTISVEHVKQRIEQLLYGINI